MGKEFGRDFFGLFKKPVASDGGLAKAVGQVINKPKEKPVEKNGKPITTGRDPDEGTHAWYRRMFAACEIDSGYEGAVRNSLKIVEKPFHRYLNVAERLGVTDPDLKVLVAFIIGFLHFKESSCNFNGILHNGQKGVIGEYAMKHNIKSTIVPKGVGPFATWEDSAVDAIHESSRWRKVLSGISDVGEILYQAERFNGAGYLSKTSRAGAETSPYLWARSNINDGHGKYVRDHVFDSNAETNKTTGFAVLLKLAWQDGKIKLTGV